MNVYEYFLNIATLLGDNSPSGAFQRYPLQTLINAYNDAIAIIAQAQPLRFAVINNVKLVTGIQQSLDACSTNVIDVIAQVDEHGGEIKKLEGFTTTRVSSQNLWQGESCLTHTSTTGDTIGFVLNYANKDSEVPTVFRVDPPVPKNTDVYVKVKYVLKPTLIDKDLLESDFNELYSGIAHADFISAVAKEYIMATMLQSNTNSYHATSSYQLGMNAFYQYIKIPIGGR